MLGSNISATNLTILNLLNLITAISFFLSLKISFTLVESSWLSLILYKRAQQVKLPKNIVNWPAWWPMLWWDRNCKSDWTLATARQAWCWLSRGGSWPPTGRWRLAPSWWWCWWSGSGHTCSPPWWTQTPGWSCSSVKQERRTPSKHWKIELNFASTLFLLYFT